MLSARRTFIPPNGSDIPQPTGVSGSWDLVFRDEFEGDALDTDVWCPGWWPEDGISDPANSAETAAYSSANVSVSSGYLQLLLTVDQITAPNGTTYPYTGSLVSSNPVATGQTGFVGFAPGCVVEYRANIPLDGWGACWAVAPPAETYVEIDTLENLVGTFAAHLHDTSDNAPGYDYGTAADLSGEFQVFTAEWTTDNTVIFYLDGTEQGTLDFTADATSPLYLILNNTTSAAAGDQDATTMLVDYVRVWEAA